MAIEPVVSVPLLALAAGGGAILTYWATHPYRNLWRRLRPDGGTPTGFGALLAAFVVIGALVGLGPAEIVLTTAIVALATAVYWIDDARGLSVRLRFGIQFGVGAAIAGLVMYPVLQDALWALVGLCLLGGIVNIVLTNIINFYDGADLNLGTFIFLTAVCLAAFAASDATLLSVAIMLMAFIVPFALVNRVPRSLYLGDAGAFAFACLLTMIAALYLRSDGAVHPLVFAPAVLPAVDTAFVFALRLAKREDLLSRNWHHLYQRLQIERPGFLYLLPQVINLAVVVSAALALEALGLHRFWASLVAMAAITPTFYFASRRLMLRAPWLG